jgi:hypothetical protein
MKKSILFIIPFIIIFTSCESILNNTDDEYLFQTDGGLKYKYSDFELYDSSTHILYFKTHHPEFGTDNSTTFSLLVNGEEVYDGVFHSAVSSYMPSGPYIQSDFSFYPDYIIKIDFSSIDGSPEDTRNDPRLISALEEHDLLHSGLSMDINLVGIKGSELTFKFTITNNDESDLLILDIEKTGPGLFHYFTNGLSIRELTYEEVFSSTIQHETPSPWDSWNSDWLSNLRPGDSRQFTIEYPVINSIDPGVYKIMFEFPGFGSQVSLEQLYQNGSRIWLGDIKVTKQMTLE